MKRRAGFTLLELVVTIAIIAILAAIITPVYWRVERGAKATACLSNLRQLGVALNLYLADHNSVFPMLQGGRTSITQDVPVIDNTLNTYVPNARVFACPDDSRNLAAITGTSYYWNTALDGQSLSNLTFLAVISDHSRIPILADKEANHPYTENKVNVLCADGHVSKDLTFFTSN